MPAKCPHCGKLFTAPARKVGGVTPGHDNPADTFSDCPGTGKALVDVSTVQDTPGPAVRAVERPGGPRGQFKVATDAFDLTFKATAAEAYAIARQIVETADKLPK